MSLAGAPPAALVERAGGVPTRGKSLIAILVARGLATEDDCRRALKECVHGEPLARALVRTGAVTEGDLAVALAEASHTPFVSLEPYPELAEPIDPAEARLSSRRMVDPVTASTARLLPPSLCLARRMVLLSVRGGEGLLAMADPFDATALREARQRTGLKLRRGTADPAEIAAAVERAWSGRAIPVLPSPGDGVRRAIVAAAIAGLVALLGFIAALRESLDLDHAFAVLALACGLTFFVYAARYYVATAVVVGAVAFAASARWAALRSAWSGRPDADGYRMLRGDPPPERLPAERQPFVSVQVALYNEQRVVDRLLEACTSFDYQSYEVIVADDSTDATVALLERWKDHPRVRVLHRPERRGFKGGALQEALKRMDPRTEYVLVFDADFVPPPDAIWHFLDHFGRLPTGVEGPPRGIPGSAPPGTRGAAPCDDETVAAVQGYQWHMLNASENWITKAIRAEFSGSYVLERAAQELFGAMKMISGSVYMIRADVLRRLGWSTSITEDWELTIRLYLAGYRVRYTPYIQSPAECVGRIRQLIRQRMRWARGHTFNVRKYFLSVMRSPRIGWREKVEFLFYAPYYLQSVVLLFGTVSWILGVFLLDQDLPQWSEVLGWSLVVSNMLALPLMNLAGLVLEGSARRDASGLLGSIALSMILVPFQAWAALCGLFDPDEGGWARTPKSGRITEAVARLRLPRLLPWALPRRTYAASTHLTVIAVVAAVGILTVGALSLRAAAASGAGDGEEIFLAALGTVLPLAALLVGWRRLRRRAAAALIAFCVALTANVVFLASTVPADATAGVASTFMFRNATAFAAPSYDMEQGYTPAGAATQTPASLGNDWTATFASDVFPSTASMSAGSATVDLYGENNVATISFVNAGAQVAGTTGSLTPALPTGWAANDLAVLIVAGRPLITDTSEPSVTGWTQRSSRYVDVAAITTDLKIITYWRVLQGGDGNPSVSVGTWINGMSAQVAAWRGVNTTTPFDAADVLSDSAAALTWTPSAITSASANAWVASAVATSDNNGLILGTANGFTGRMTGANYDTTLGADHAVGLADLLQAAAGAATMLSWTQSTGGPDAWAGITFALRPATRSCTITATLKHVSGTTTTLGSGTGTLASPSSTSGTLTQITFATSAVSAFADGDRLRLEVSAPLDATSCNARLHFDGASQQSKLVTATIVPEALLALLLLAPALPPLARRLGRRRAPER